MSEICNCERRKAIFGAIVMCFSFLVAFFGSDSQFGYLHTHTMLSIAVILIANLYGAFRIAFWLQCLMDYNSKTKL